MKYLKKFENNTSYETYIEGDDAIKPNVSLVGHDEVHYNPYDPYNGHEYVDLGLPSGTLWATMNVGATSETGYGLYFQWGDTQGYTADQVGSSEGKKAFTWSDYKFNPSGDGSTLTKYNPTDGKTTLDLEDDAAAVNWGGSWHMPTEEQFLELCNTNNCTNVYTTINGVGGRLFTSVKNGNTLFIPSAGCTGSRGNMDEVGYSVFVWSSYLNPAWYRHGRNFN